MKLRIILLILGLLAFLTASLGGYLYYSALKSSVVSEVELQAASQAETIKALFSSYSAPTLVFSGTFIAILTLSEIKSIYWTNLLTFAKP